MAFTIPNHADANSPFQAEPDSVDFDILAAGYSGSGVISGCAVTAQGSPNMTVAVASGIISVAGVRVSVTGANATIGTADGTDPRFDMITVNSSGTIATTAGTAASVPELPSIPSVSIVIALIFVPASDTTIATAQITDKRIFISNGGSGVLDNIIWNLGSDGDAAMVLSSAIIAADAEVTNVIEGTSDHLATTANSLIISNVTNDGDILFVVSDGGNSKGLLHLDGANGRVVIHGGDLLMSGAQKIYFFDVGGEYMSSDGSTLTITGATALTPTIGATAWNAAQHTHAGATTGGTVSAASATVASTVVVVDGTDTSSFVAIFDSATGSLAPKTDGGLTYNAGTGMLTATGFTGPLTGNASGSSGSTTGNAATATALASAVTIGGVSFDGSGAINLPGVNTAGSQATSGLAATATLAATVTVIDSTDTTSFVALIDAATGDLAIKTDAGLAYNSGTGMLTATGLTGPLTGTATGLSGSVLTGDVTSSGNAATLVLSNLTGAAINVAADSIPFLDADGSATRIESIADLATAMAGTNLTASSGQLVAGAAGAGIGLVIALS